jgi:serine/threonine protein kinase
MMAFVSEGGSSEHGIGFKTVVLFKDQPLGIGSYGSVCKAKCDDLICAAKILHPTLIDPIGQPDSSKRSLHRRPSSRFELECEFLSVMRHPNIVQFLAFYNDPTTGLPVILMELMDDNLTNFLRGCREPLPYHVQVNLCHDITKALSFLHSNDIIHRDLSGNNVLLFSNLKAKVSDFGMARLGLNPQLTHRSLTMCPGTDVYMPPEAVEDKPVYTEKIDCFSFGVITLQILTQEFPKPGDRRQKVVLDHPGIPAGTLELRVSEVDRRQNHILLVDPSHPLILVVFDCLKDIDRERPSAQDLSEAMASLKESQGYMESLKNPQGEGGMSIVTDKDREIKSLKDALVEQAHHLQQVMNQLEERELTLSAMKDDIVQLDQTLEREIQQKQAKNEEIGSLHQQLKESNQMITELRRHLSDLKPPPLPVRRKYTSKSLSRGAYLDYREMEANQNKSRDASMVLRWRVGGSAPVALCRWSDAVVTDSTVYFKNGYSSEVYAYVSVHSKWCQIVDCRCQGCSLVMVNGMLTAVGGWNANQLFSLVDEKDSDSSVGQDSPDDDTHCWAELFPPMPTKRCWTICTCLSSESVLIVAGGEGPTEEEKALATVELMDTNSLQWSTAAGLPAGLKIASATACNGRVYLLGGKTSSGTSSTTAFVCSLADLLQSSHNQLPSPDSEGTTETSDISKENDDIWSIMANLPLVDCTCVSLSGQLLVIGGRSLGEEGSCSTAVNVYCADTDTWEEISNMSIGRSLCFAAVLPDNQLMVVGGMVIGDLCTKTIKFATAL